ncbi:hypothetical protein FGIG_07328 [Fasciola gigantica]|uniref:Uncharacterized protein n=1 Tax=Fasciola gigantica TaxID=46835 RepID=A0A504Z4K2_FASGI|nr:hypothetical protein FGIG_07328 [Fasciola gigantica]
MYSSSLCTDPCRLPTSGISSVDDAYELDEPGYSLSLALRLLQQVRRVSQRDTEQFRQDSTNSTIVSTHRTPPHDEPQDDNSEAHRCKYCNQPLPTSASLQTAILRHRRHCTAL